MRKKLTLMFVALLSIAAFAATQALKRSQGSSLMIKFTEAVAAGNLQDNYSDGDFKLTRTDGGGKHSIDGNNAYFGTAEDYQKFEYRLKVGGTSGAANSLQLAIPADGTLKVYVRTSKSSATDRTLVLAQGGKTLYNNVVKEDDAVEVSMDSQNPDNKTKVYRVVEVRVVTGTVDITYPVGALNFYGFEFIPNPEDITISPASGDISTALAEASEGKIPQNITINLTEGASYTISAPIVAPASVTINGNGATIDASGLSGNMIEMAVVENPTEWTEANVTVKELTVKGLKKALFYSACKNYFGDVTVDKCVVEQAADATTFDYTKGSTAVNFTVTNSTFYAPTATTKSFYSSQSGQKTTEYDGNAVQTFKFENNTMYNLAPGKNFFTHRQNSQKWLKFVAKNNIFADCGKSGQTIKGMNGGGSSANPQFDIDGNVFNFGGADTGASESTGDEVEPVKNTIAGVVTFADAAAGDFNGTIALGEGVAEPATMPGDPRWKVEVPAEDIETTVASGDISTALDIATAGKKVGNITINLTAGTTYTISAPIVAPASVTINGNGATIDASALGGNFIEMAVVESPTEWTEANVSIKGVTVKGLKKALFYSACKNYYGDFTVDNSVVELAADATTFDYTKGSTAVNFTVTNSTFYAPTATTKSFYSSQSGQKTTEYDGNAVQTFKFENNTMYNLAPGKNFFTHRQNSQKWLKFVAKNNIFADCGKSGQTIKGMNGGGSSANPQFDIDGNVFNFGGADTGASESTGDEAEPVKNTIAGVVTFTDVATGDFNGNAAVALAPATPTLTVGDPRWTITATQVPVDVEISPASGDIAAALAAASEGKIVKNITINLTASETPYTVSAAIVAPASVTINGNGATIDASALGGNFIEMAVVESPTEWTEANVSIKGVTVKGLKKALFYSACKNYYGDFTVDNSVVELAADATTFDYTKGSTAVNFTVTNSTFYAPTATTKSFYSSQSGQKTTEYDGNAVQTFKFENNTMYNLAPGKNFFTHRQNSQKWLKFVAKNNIFADCGKSGQTIKGMNGGGSSANPQFDIDGNVFNFGGADTGASESTGDEAEPVKNTIAGVVTFTDAAAGDFNGTFALGEGATAPATMPGDPRWTLTAKNPVTDMGASTAAIEVEVPANLGAMDGTNGPTDLALFLDSYLQNSPNPAYIKLTLQGGANYVISKPIETITAIQILGNDVENPAVIDANSIDGFVKISDSQISGTPNEMGFYSNIYNVELKNFEVKNLGGALFNANGQKYVIPNFTVENVLVQTTGGTVIDMDGSVVENLTVTKSTMNGAALAYKATTDAASAGVTAQTINASYNTFYQVIGLQIGAMLTAPQMSNRSMAPTSNLSLDFNHNVVISDNFAFNGQAPSSMLVQYNSFVKEDGTDNNAILAKIPGVGGTIEGDLTFATPDDVVNGNLGLGVCPQREAKIGDPRWLNAAMKISAADLDDDKDLAKAINAAVEIGITKFQLEENARYTAKQTIVADKAIAITGKNVIIDVEHNDPFILLSKTPTGGFMPKASTEAAAPALNRAAGVEYTDYYKFDELTLSGLKVNGLKNSIIYDNNVKYCVIDLTIDDCVMQLETEAVKYEALIAFQAGGVNNLTIKNSTFYGNNEVAKYFVRYNNSARIDRFGFDKADATWSFTYENNTFYGLLKSDGQWGNYSGIVGKNAQGIVTVKNNIWYDCDSQTMRRMLGSKKFAQFSKASLMENNTFIVGGAAADQGNYGNGSDLTGDPGFKRPAEGDFTLSAYSVQFDKKTGDPRWYADGGHYNPVTGIEGVEAEKADDGAWYTIQGVRVDKPAKGLYIHNGKKVVVK